MYTYNSDVQAMHIIIGMHSRVFVFSLVVCRTDLPCLSLTIFQNSEVIAL